MLNIFLLLYLPAAVVVAVWVWVWEEYSKSKNVELFLNGKTWQNLEILL